MNTTIRLILAILLLICWLKVPYGYFQFIRLAGCIAFLWLSYEEFNIKRRVTAILCILGAIILNPIFKIHFARLTWNVIDTVLAGLLLIWAILIFTNGKKIE